MLRKSCMFPEFQNFSRFLRATNFKFLAKIAEIIFRHSLADFSFWMGFEILFDNFGKCHIPFYKLFPVLIGIAVPNCQKTRRQYFASFSKLRFAFVLYTGERFYWFESFQLRFSIVWSRRPFKISSRFVVSMSSNSFALNSSNYFHDKEALSNLIFLKSFTNRIPTHFIHIKLLFRIVYKYFTEITWAPKVATRCRMRW